jgi:anionic cell wall polymer biosynthesis LytR-Cps2A-Psr (LCP) family protein
MRKVLFHKSTIILWLIVSLFVAAIAIAIFGLKAQSISAQLKTDRPINVLMVFEQGGKPVSTQLLMFYPSRSKAALLDIPANTAVILKTIKRMDRIDYTYRSGNPKTYLTEVSSYLDVQIHGYLLWDEAALSRTVDLLDGVQLFIPSVILQPGPAGIRLPGGAVTLDGDKVAQYLRYKEEGEGDSDLLLRRQKIAVAILKKLSEKSSYLKDKQSGDALAGAFASNFSQATRRRLLEELSKFDADSALLQKITGIQREVEGNALFFPFYDGELARDMLKQTLNAMSSTEVSVSGGKIYTVEILNGTSEKGLATRTADIFESFGYDVVSVGNTDSQELAKTTIIDRFGDKTALANVAGVIRCSTFAEASTYKGSIRADYTIILGKDFNGRVIVR